MKFRVAAPGRVNLIGEHTDYNLGFVMPAAIDLFLELTYESYSDSTVTAFAEGFGPAESFSLNNLEPVQGPANWVDYIKAVYWALQTSGYQARGAIVSLTSTIPVGAGLSSSAALELALAKAITVAEGFEIALPELALICQRAENDFVGVHCGIMDQYAVAFGSADKALLLDCRSLEYSYIPLELGSLQLLIVDSRVERSLAASAYNKRREECEVALTIISSVNSQPLESLRDVTLEMIRDAQPYLSDRLYNRSRYVVEENIRVLEAAAALRREDFLSFGYFMKRSHAGLRDLYEVSCPELDLIVARAIESDAVLGARMTGAGFGGCAVLLVEGEAVSEVTRRLKEAFASADLVEPLFYQTCAAQGVHLIAEKND
jgi:galactokinase